jgi:uncharacterized protein YjdB
MRTSSPAPIVLLAALAALSCSSQDAAPSGPAGPTAVASIDISPSSANVVVGSAITLSAEPRDSAGHALPDRTITWTSQNSSLATVANGVVTGVAAGGPVTISAMAEGKSASATIVVAPVPVASVSITPSPASVAVSRTVQLSAVAKDAAHNVLSGRLVTWSTSNASKATISSTGLVSGVASGTTTITATIEGKSASDTVTVTATTMSVASVAIYPAGTTLLPSQTWQLTATPKDATGNALTGVTVTWSTSDATKATVSAAGLVTAVAPGTATITATSQTKSSSVTMTVVANGGNLLQVGPTRSYKTPCSAIAAAKGGETIEIDAATYTGDVCVISKPGLTLRGVGGRPKLDAGGKSAEGKAIWVIRAANTVVDNIEFANCTVADLNGSGIKSEWGNLTVRNSLFDHNQFGILTGYDSTATILIDGTEFAYQGSTYASSNYHNMYINAGTFILQRSYSHHTIQGNLVKTRSRYVYILYNRISSENGASSYEVDIPNGGRAYIIGNVIQQGAQSANRWIIEFGAEGQTAGHRDELFVVNNTIVNDVGTAYGIYVASWVQTPIIVRNNIFGGPFNTITNQASAVLESNHLPANGDPMFVNPAAYDYRLKAGSPAINGGIAPGSAFGYDLTPKFEYVHPLQNVARTLAGSAIDKGAYEYAP